MKPVLGVLLVAVVAACGSDGSPRGPIADPAAFLAELPRVECEHLARCGVYGSVDECVAARPQRALVTGLPYSQWQFDPRIVGAVARGTVVYSPVKAGECLDAMGERSCEWTSDPAASVCNRVLVGTVPDGGVPAYSFECISGWQSSIDCDGFSTCCDAACEPAPGDGDIDGDPGEPLDVDNDGEDHCDRSVGFAHCARLGETCGSDLRCHPYRHAGQTCNDTTEWCDLGSFCDRDQGRCIGIAGEGEPCFRESSGPYCAAGLHCHVSDDRDAPLLCRPLLADGGECGIDLACLSGNCDVFAKRCEPLPTCP